MKNKYFMLIVFLSLFNYAHTQTSFIGTKVPDLIFKKVLNYTDTTCKVSDFAGKAIVIDFWATWCGSCIEGFPMLDSLQKTFSTDLKVMTITSDNESRIIKFLTKFNTNLPIVIDDKNEFSKIFPHRSIPHTILIDKKGVIKAVTTSANINKENIQKLINGDDLNIDEKKDNLTFDPIINSLSGTSNVLIQITLMPFNKGLGSMSTGFKNGRRTFINLLPSTIYEVLYDFPAQTRSFWEADIKKYKWAEENLYCLEIIAPNKTEKEIKQILINYLQSNIGLKARIEEKEKKVKILKKKGDNMQLEIAKNTDKFDFESSGRGLKMQNALIKVLVNHIEGQLKVPIIDETGLEKVTRLI